MDDEIPIPQADNPVLIRSVILGVAAGVDTDDRISKETLNYAHSQGPYYANAAWALGFIQPAGTFPRSWELTTDGDYFMSLSESDQADFLCAAIECYVAADVIDIIDESRLAKSTKERRKSTHDHWVAFARLPRWSQVRLFNGNEYRRWTRTLNPRHTSQQPIHGQEWRNQRADRLAQRRLEIA